MEANQMDGQIFIGDAIDIICEYLQLKDLSTIAQVCKTWRDAAWREKAKRLCIQQFHIPYDLSHVASKLDVNRYVPLLIYDSSFPNSLQNPNVFTEHEKQLLKLLKIKRIPKSLILTVDEHLTTREVNFYGARDQCEFLGYFFPNLARRTDVRVACIQKFDPEDIDMEIDRFGEKLGFDDCEYPTSTILFFTSHQQILNADVVIHLLRRRVDIGGKCTWTSIFGHSLRVANCTIDNMNKSKVWQDLEFAAIRICGRSVESWSTFIYCLAQRDVIERKLEALKKRVKPNKKHYAGLIYSRKCVEKDCTHEEHPCCNCHEIMRYVNRVFPGIPFVGLFQRSSITALTAAINSFEQDDGFYLFLNTSIIIISFD